MWPIVFTETSPWVSAEGSALNKTGMYFKEKEEKLPLTVSCTPATLLDVSQYITAF